MCYFIALHEVNSRCVNQHRYRMLFSLKRTLAKGVINTYEEIRIEEESVEIE